MTKPKYQLNPDGSIGSDDLDAILELQRRILDKVPTRPKPVLQLKSRRDALNGQSPAMDFLRKLPAVGTKLNAEQMVPLVGAKSAYGVGPRLRKFGAVMDNAGMDIGDYISTRKTDTGSTVWVVKKVYS